MERWIELMREVEARHGVVTYADLVAFGMSPSQVSRLCERGRLERLHRGTYRVTGAPRTLEAEAAGAIQQVGDDDTTWLGFFTSTRLWGVPVYGRERRIELIRPVALSAARAGIVVHRSTYVPEHHVTVLRGLPITTPSRTLFDLARIVGPKQLARGVRHAIHSDDIPCTLLSLYRVLYDLGGRGRPGTRRMRQVLDGWSADEPATESEVDEVGRALLRLVPGIEWQVEVSDERGYVRRLDGFVRSARLNIEFDSRFHDDPVQRALDDDNDRRLEAMGILTVRFRKPDLTRRGDLTVAEVLRLVGAPRAA